ncbi:MAG: PIN domain-containing protein [Deltaproteobacteria bacterium]|jgi:PIN domain nuclease of toxin-antitoxin system|nr:PIN domain-containing protein [Deltaproteobacteria bacterium]
MKSQSDELLCFYACALLALLQDESGADKAAAAVIAANNGEAENVMNRINLLEVYCDVYRSRGEEQAKVKSANLKKHQVEIYAEIADKNFAEAGRLKASYKISLADSIALAQTIAIDAELLTADHHEFDVS